MSISTECYYSSLVAARLLSRAAFFFSLVLRWLLCDSWWPATTSATSSSSDDGESAAEAAARHAAAAQAVRDGLRASTYGEFAGEDESPACAAVTCAVCLGEVHGRDSVWELGNCRHVFHKGCLDRWLDHDERLTCPLCRAPLLSAPAPPLAGASSSAAGASSEISWAVDRLLYLFGDDLLFAPYS